MKDLPGGACGEAASGKKLPGFKDFNIKVKPRTVVYVPHSRCTSGSPHRTSLDASAATPLCVLFDFMQRGSSVSAHTLATTQRVGSFRLPTRDSAGGCFASGRCRKQLARFSGLIHESQGNMKAKAT